ncbi:unnamed protein product [Cuscuta campestris]|uniref:alpha,alpha-trehalose-phosphate synthase (UDP-forming) n=1 Tax=Cuscuta campestris TaxID=132261 RepID=A0A484LSF2_9ASTE|nr:unnamed protein product [Cuscuta campestris]
MPGNKYVETSAVTATTTTTTRVERLLRERELRKVGKPNQLNDSVGCNGGIELSDRDLDQVEADDPGVPQVEQCVEGAPRVLNEEREAGNGNPIRQRLLVVANRLPVSAVRKEDGSWALEISAGGLVTALLGIKEFEATWIGWAGVDVSDEAGQKSLSKALAEKRCVPVFLDTAIVDQYYNGYCNNILWPHLHYLGLPQEDHLATTRTFQSQFDAFKRANQMFADVVAEHYKDGDVVWCHDYHLMFLPECLKKNNSKMKVGWFLHTPFPSSEIHRTLPSRSELLRALLAADLVGFHTYDYARHFVSACARILGLEGTPEGVEDQGRLTRVAAFPIGIDSKRFIRAIESPQVQAHMKDLLLRFAGRKVMLGVDRLDMIKGIPLKILAFEKFLEENPYWRDKVVLLQIAVPTRTDVPEYQKLTSQVHEVVGRINGRFGTVSSVPIHHLDRSLDFQALCALYAVTDVALITSLRDGMNLVSYEFVACQASKKGVLILSEFAGAAQSLGAGAILVNPWNVTEVAASIKQAFEMSAEEREKRHLHNYTHVTTHTSQEWAETFVSELNDTVFEAQQRIKAVPPRLNTSDAIDRYLQSNNRLLILGFNGVLTEMVDRPERRGRDQIKDMELKLHPSLNGPLAALCRDPKTTIVILSGSDRSDLDANFGKYDMWLAAEHGMFLRSTNGEWMTTMPELLSMDWVDSVKHVFEYFTERTPRSHFEMRETSLVWNYKYADVEFGRLQARDMLQHLWTGPISNASVDVVQGHRSVEVRAVGVTKGAAIDRILGEIVHNEAITTPIDYVMCMGHFIGKDEDVYSFFEPELPCDGMGVTRSKLHDAMKIGGERRKSSSSRRTNNNPVPMPNQHHHHNTSSGGDIQSPPINGAWNVLDLNKENYFSCAVGRTRTNARYLINSSEDVVTFLTDLAAASASTSPY